MWKGGVEWGREELSAEGGGGVQYRKGGLSAKGVECESGEFSAEEGVECRRGELSVEGRS